MYLDYASTTPVSKKVMATMRPYFSKSFGNAGSLHIEGQKAQEALDNARHQIAKELGADWKEIIFTPSATSSINLALRGVVSASGIKKPHIVTTNIEHSAVLDTCRDLENQGVEISYLQVGKDGFITPEQVQGAIKQNTVLVSIGYVNSEIGTIQPIKRIAEVVSGSAVFHTDAVQAANYLSINVEDLGVDMATLSSHKIYGPKGSALLYKKDKIKLNPVITGGGQERGYASGTENIPAIVGFAEALKEAQSRKQEEAERLRKLQENFFKEAENIKGVEINGSRQNRAPNNINIYFKNKKTDVLIPLFDKEGISVSGGSACTSRTPEPSHVIMAIGREEYAKSSIRATMGRDTTKKDIDKFAEVVKRLA